jgi:predicted TIM-barrel fold metal-dependent hydrolase
MKIIDMSAYYGQWPHWPIKTNTQTDLIALLDKVGIEQTVVASTRSVFTDCKMGNDEVDHLAKNSNGRVHAFAIVNPIFEKAACDLLKSANQSGMRGFRLTPQHHQYHLDDDPGLNEVLALGQDLGMTVVIPIRLILHWGLPQLDVREINSVAQNFPKLKIIVGGVNYSEVRDTLAVMRRHENVGIETSCLQMVNGIETLVNKAGAERVYMGTGLPLMYPLPGIYKIQKAQISEKEKELILGGNAARIFSGTEN